MSPGLSFLLQRTSSFGSFDRFRHHSISKAEDSAEVCGTQNLNFCSSLSLWQLCKSIGKAVWILQWWELCLYTASVWEIEALTKLTRESHLNFGTLMWKEKQLKKTKKTKKCTSHWCMLKVTSSLQVTHRCLTFAFKTSAKIPSILIDISDNK